MIDAGERPIGGTSACTDSTLETRISAAKDTVAHNINSIDND